jgi:hypothetical protein
VDSLEKRNGRAEHVMNRRWNHIPLIALSVLLSASTTNAQQCSNCDCYHFPIPKKCESCCGVASGKITSVTNSSVVISEKESTSDAATVKKTFALKPDTKKNGVLREGAPATVYYRKEGNVATQVDLVEALKGLLVPGDQPDPPLPSSCYRLHPVPPDALRVYLGGNAGYTTGDQVTVLNVKGTDLLDFRRTSKGLAINAKTFSEDGKIIAEIIDNRFYINANNFFRMEKPDSHSIIVYDIRDRKVLDITFINSHSVKVLGIFQFPDAAPVIIDEAQLSLGGNNFFGSCFSGAKLIHVE